MHTRLAAIREWIWKQFLFSFPVSRLHPLLHPFFLPCLDYVTKLILLSVFQEVSFLLLKELMEAYVELENLFKGFLDSLKVMND